MSIAHGTRGAFVVGGAAALGAAATASAFAAGPPAPPPSVAETIVYNGKITTFDPKMPHATAFAVVHGRIALVGDDARLLGARSEATRMIDAKGKTIVPGLIDSHTHLIRGGLSYNQELRWDGVPSIADALRMLAVQAARTPAPQWVRVVGGWSEFQFAEKRMPTLDEINAATGDVPTIVLNLYRVALLNRAALRALGYTRTTPTSPGGEIVRDAAGTPTGMFVAKPSPQFLTRILARGPQLSHADRANSTQLFMRELNRLGITSCVDAGGLGQQYPDDYDIFAGLAKAGKVTVRTAYSLDTQHPGAEAGDILAWIGNTKPYTGDSYYRQNGAGEILVYSADDYSDFAEERPATVNGVSSDLSAIVTLLAQNNWPFHIHATYGETIAKILDVIERVNAKVPFNAPFWLDHAETIADREIARMAALKGGIAIQDRMAFQGEYFVQRYGAERARNAPPVKKMLAAGVTVGAGTDATRLASYNPWVALYWLVTQKTVGGLLLSEENTLAREEAMRLFTVGSAWFSGEEKTKGAIAERMLADVVILSDDYFSVPENKIATITADLTMVGGTVVHAQGDFASLAPALPAASPSWSPIRTYGAAHSPVVGMTTNPSRGGCC